MTKRTKALHCYVSDAAHDWWHHHAALAGVTVSAWLQAIADNNLQPEDWLAADARKIDAERRRRKS